ncbi:MAG: zf-HC2 domain-containing protein [Candidatus Eisenbacteria bacterium]
MSCRERQDGLQAYLAGELTGAESHLLEEHLRGCPACRRDLAAYRMILEALPVIPDPPLPADLHGRVMASWRAQKQPAWKLRETRLEAGLRRAVAVLLAAAFGLSLSVALWGWLGRIASAMVQRTSQDLVSIWGTAREMWQILGLLGDVARILQPPAVGLAEGLRRSAQPLVLWGPLLLAAYAALAALGVWLCWRAIRRPDERGYKHAA